NPPGSGQKRSIRSASSSLHVWRVSAPLKLRGGGEGWGGGTRGAERATPRIPLCNLASAAGAKSAPRGDQPHTHPADPPIWVSLATNATSAAPGAEPPVCN